MMRLPPGKIKPFLQTDAAPMMNSVIEDVRGSSGHRSKDCQGKHIEWTMVKIWVGCRIFEY